MGLSLLTHGQAGGYSPDRSSSSIRKVLKQMNSVKITPFFVDSERSLTVVSSSEDQRLGAPDCHPVE